MKQPLLIAVAGLFLMNIQGFSEVLNRTRISENPRRNHNLVQVKQIEKQIAEYQKAIEDVKDLPHANLAGYPRIIEQLETEADQLAAAKPVWVQDVEATLTKADSDRLRQKMKSPVATTGNGHVDCMKDHCTVTLVLEGGVTGPGASKVMHGTSGYYLAEPKEGMGKLMLPYFKREPEGNAVRFKTSDEAVELGWDQENQWFEISINLIVL